MKNRIEEYEDKIKNLIKEFEDESKKHIKEVNEIHEHYRSYKSKASELEQRIDQYKKDCQLAQKSERILKKELIQATFSNDELDEKCKYLE
jgi:chromosome segregation ATPase